ncbi:hypothetical protein H0484_12430 [Pusillimonas sp. CC-YST705]|uniref:Polysaccharide biosynthesis protein n=1 Tax=Mesopusillimonas faecipullorum TaxID=2755040 RepID=A0ABS8CEW5_9BURK|nr:hypothetical protein [Mesopusillimonas faecipullorum]MCB5364553.1 hypothetical protein [Mesopusillimonas faecipullorum]
MLKLRSSRLLSQAFLSLFDQAWLSALNLALGLVLIRMVSKESYGVYSQLFAAGLFATSLLEALVSNPLVNVVSGKSGDERAVIIQHISRYQGRASSLIAVLLGLGCAWASSLTAQPYPLLLGVVFGLFIKLNAMREYARSLAFLEGLPTRVLRVDLWYGISVFLGVVALYLCTYLQLVGIFGVFALANISACLLAGQAPGRTVRAGGETYAETVRQVWRRGRLGLPGAGLAWGVNYSYLYLVAAWLGAAAAAELAASRLLLMPVSLLVVAWSRVARPQVGRLVVADAHQDLNRLLFKSLLALLALAATYVLAAWLLLPWLQTYVLAGKYDAAGPLLLWWGGYFAIYTIRWVGTIALMGKDYYGFMLIESVMSFAAMFGVLALAVPRYGERGAIIALIVVELFSLAMTWGRYLYREQT